MPQTMALVCFLKRVVALAAQGHVWRGSSQESQLSTSTQTSQNKNTQARGGGETARGVTGEEVEDGTAGRGNKPSHTQTTAAHPSSQQHSTLSGLSMNKPHRPLTGSFIGINILMKQCLLHTVLLGEYFICKWLLSYFCRSLVKAQR